jgi:hypothetical protein
METFASGDFEHWSPLTLQAFHAPNSPKFNMGVIPHTELPF